MIDNVALRAHYTRKAIVLMLISSWYYCNCASPDGDRGVVATIFPDGVIKATSNYK